MRSVRLTAGLLSLVATLSFAGAASAQEEDAEEPNYIRDGWYFGLQYNLGIEDWVLSDGLEDVDNSNGLGVYVGWRFLKYWGMDLQYEWQSGFGGTAASVSGEANANVFTVNGRAYLPFGRVQPFVLVGMGLIQSTAKVAGGTVAATGDFTGRFGGGLDLYLTKNWVLEASATYIQPAGDLSEQRYLSIGAGLQYRFNPHVY